MPLLGMVVGCALNANVPILADRGTDYAPLAVAAGRLEERSGCLVLASPAGEVWAIAWPDNTTWDEVSGTVTVRGVTVRVGADAELSGGEFSTPDEVDAGEWINPPSDACLAFDKMWWATSVVTH